MEWIARIRNARDELIKMAKRAESFDTYIKFVVATTRLSEYAVRSCLPTRDWSDFQANAERYVDVLINRMENTVRKWYSGYRKAFTTPADRNMVT